MQPIMRLVLPVIGLLIAASLGSPASRAFDIIVGAALGFAIADLGLIRARLDELSQAIERLRTEFRPRQDATAPPAIHPEAAPAPQPRAEFHEPAQSTPRRPLDRLWEDFEPRPGLKLRNRLSLLIQPRHRRIPLQASLQ